MKTFRLIKKHIPTLAFDPDIYRVPCNPLISSLFEIIYKKGEMIINQGYPYEEHKIVTDDKYILTVKSKICI